MTSRDAATVILVPRDAGLVDAGDMGPPPRDPDPPEEPRPSIDGGVDAGVEPSAPADAGRPGKGKGKKKDDEDEDDDDD